MMIRSANELPDAIQWHEGMLLAPQHFQQLALRNEELLSYHMLASAPFHWGVRHLKTDPVLLVNGTFRLLEIEAIMPDGLIFSHIPGDQGHLEIDLTEFQDAIQVKPQTVHLVVPVRRLGAVTTTGELPRYESVEGPPVMDESTGESDLRIPRLTPRVSLLLADAAPQKYVGFPVAKIAFENETFTLTEFLPPTLHLGQQSPMGESCLNLATRLREKAVYLSEKTRSPAAQADRPMLRDAEAQIHALVSALPPFEASLKTDCSHPFLVYMALCSIVGQMTMVAGTVPPVLAAYDHNDARASFDQAISYITHMLDRISESYSAIPFAEAQGIFSLHLQRAWLGDRLTIGVRARPEMTERDILDWLESALIGSATVIPSMQTRRVLGAARHQIERDADLDLMPTRGVLLFHIDTGEEFVQPNEVLQIMRGDRVPRDAPLEIVLYVPNQQQE